MTDPDLREELNRVRRLEQEEARRTTERPAGSPGRTATSR
jgi:hypothetical protein